MVSLYFVHHMPLTLLQLYHMIPYSIELGGILYRLVQLHCILCTHSCAHVYYVCIKMLVN